MEARFIKSLGALCVQHNLIEAFTLTKKTLVMHVEGVPVTLPVEAGKALLAALLREAGVRPAEPPLRPPAPAPVVVRRL